MIDILGCGIVMIGFDVVFMLKLNLLGVWDWGLVGGVWFVGGVILLFFDLFFLFVFLICNFLDGLKGLLVFCINIFFVFDLL